MEHEDRGGVPNGDGSPGVAGGDAARATASSGDEAREAAASSLPDAPSTPEAPPSPPEAPPSPPTEELPVAVATEPVPTSPVVAAGTDAAGGAPARPRRRALAVIGYVAAAVLGAAVVVAAFVGSGVASFGPSPTPAPTFASSGQTVGVPGAPVAIEIWADYQCPYCGLFAHGIEPTLFRDYAATGRATVSFRDFAFLGQESIDAAVAARCAGRQGRFWTYHDLLYASQNGENQGAFGRKNLDALADFAGLDRAAFDACLVDTAVAQAVAAEKEVGDGFGVSSTPTVRITGPGGTKLLKGVAQPGQIAAAVEAVASAAPSGSAPASGSPGASGATSPGASPAAQPSSVAPSPGAPSPTPSASGG